MTRKHSHYFKPVPAGVTHIDVYRVLDLFGVTDQALGHAIKKLLVAGGRGGKDVRKDITEAVDTLQRRLEMWDEALAPAADLAPLCDCTIMCAPESGTRCKSKMSVLKDTSEVWIEWNGIGIRPLEDHELVLVERRDCTRSGPQIAANFSWDHIGKCDDIVAYRVVPNGR